MFARANSMTNLRHSSLRLGSTLW